MPLKAQCCGRIYPPSVIMSEDCEVTQLHRTAWFSKLTSVFNISAFLHQPLTLAQNKRQLVQFAAAAFCWANNQWWFKRAGLLPEHQWIGGYVPSVSSLTCSLNPAQAESVSCLTCTADTTYCPLRSLQIPLSLFFKLIPHLWSKCCPHCFLTRKRSLF